MKARCYKPKSTGYQWYGGKGIRVCDEWLNKYEPFRDWAMDNGYKEGLSIDRINSNSNYEPENCRWITRSVNTFRSSCKPLKELIGHQFGRLTVLQHAGFNMKGRGAEWLCECSCGEYKIILGNSLRMGAVKSCGCWGKEYFK